MKLLLSTFRLFGLYFEHLLAFSNMGGCDHRRAEQLGNVNKIILEITTRCVLRSPTKHI